MASYTVERARGDGGMAVNFVKHERRIPGTGNKIITYTDSGRTRFQLPKTTVRFTHDPSQYLRNDDLPPSLVISADVNPEIQTWVDGLKAKVQEQVPEAGPGLKSPISDPRPRRDGDGFYPSLLRLKCTSHTKIYIQRGDELREEGSFNDIKRNSEILCIVQPRVYILLQAQGLNLNVTDVLVFQQEPEAFPFMDFGDEPVPRIRPLPVPSAPVDDAKRVPAKVYVMGEECSVCCDAAVGSVILPCAHVCMCFSCAGRIKSSAAPSCPMCRARITTVLKFNPSK